MDITVAYPCKRRPMNFAPGFVIEKLIPKSKGYYLGQIGKLICCKKVRYHFKMFPVLFYFSDDRLWWLHSTVL